MRKLVKKLNDYIINFRSFSITDKPIELDYTEVKEIIKLIELNKKLNK
jgi:hypothetical protein